MSIATIGYFHKIITTTDATILVAAAAAKKIVLLSLYILPTTTTAVTCYLYNGDNNLIGSAANPFTLDFNGDGGLSQLSLDGGKNGIVQTDTVNEAVYAKLGGAQPVIVFGTYAYTA